MPKLRRDVQVRSVSQYIRLFEPKGKLTAPAIQWYRGEGRLRPRRALLPSIARSPSVGEEWQIYQRFRQNAAAFLPHANLTPWDWMLYMRHYGQPTRLLDWSESALVALYFAVENSREDRWEGVVWCLDPLHLNELAGYDRIQCAGIDLQLNQYTPEALKAATDAADYKPAALIAPRSFSRLIAQQGVFTITHKQPIALDEIPDRKLLARVRIPSGAKANIRAALRALGMSKLSLFPELQSLAFKE
jgi:hypothetical protein